MIDNSVTINNNAKTISWCG